MLWLVLLTAPAKTVQLGPAQPVIQQVHLRFQPGLNRLFKPLETLKRCAHKNGLKPPFEKPLEIRVVRAKWLNDAFDRPAATHRRGRYYPAKNGHPALIYLVLGPDSDLTLAHEWMHHLSAVYKRDWSEERVERQAKACTAKMP